MCGLIAAFGPPIDCIDPALDALHHRGPDGRGSWQNANRTTTLGHTRLALVGGNSGRQPLTNEDETVIAIVNGEFYGHRAIRQSLERRQHRFRTRSDSEILVHLYEEYGLECTAHLRGEFAFVLWDQKRGRLFAARDRFGVKPLVFARPASGKPLLVGSEAKALFALGFEARWDRRSLWHATHHQYLPPNRTLFDGIEQLPPGHQLVADASGLTVTQWWTLDFPIDAPSLDPDSAPNLLDCLDDAVTVRLRLEEPDHATPAFYLSGGLDSSALVALASSHIARPTCFTIAFSHPPYDERAAAATVANYLGAEHHIVEVSQDTLIELLEPAVVMSEGLAINGQLPAKYALSRATAAAGFKAVLVGEGADEVLAGYPHLAADYAVWSGRAAQNARSVADGVMMPPDDAPTLASVRRLIGSVPTFLRAKAAFGRTLGRFMTPDPRFADDDPFETLFSSLELNELKGRNPVDQSTWLWTKLALAGYILKTLGDGTEMAASLEGRVPFLDRKVVDHLVKTSLHTKFRTTPDGRTVEKAVLRDAMKGRLPKSILKRTKQPLLAPPITRFDTPRVRDFAHDIINQNSGLYDARAITRWLSTLPTRTTAEQQASEPVLMTLMTASIIESHFGLT